MRELNSFTEPSSPIRVFADAEKIGNRLSLQFRLEDPGGKVLDSPHPDRSNSWPRADELWKTTCFECFLAVPGKPVYWEINFSPASHRWALYKFEDYRTPQPPASSEDLELESVSVTATSLTCELRLPVRIVELEAALTAVIRTEDGVSYFALKHKPDKADFHWRPGLTLNLSS